MRDMAQPISIQVSLSRYHAYRLIMNAQNTLNNQTGSIMEAVRALS